jgi:hypothetical protein
MKMWLIVFLHGGVAWGADPTPIFNGKDLDGWAFDVITDKVPGPEIWSVKDGILVCKGRPPAVMRTKEEFSNYELTVEWRWPAGGKPGNGGVLVHASAPRDTYVWPKSVEVQLRAGDAGDFWLLGETAVEAAGRREGRRLVNLTDGSEKPAGEWNVMTIRCEEDTLLVHVNGTKVNEAKGLSVRKGAICLQSEGAEIHFRKVTLLPLP